MSQRTGLSANFLFSQIGISSLTCLFMSAMIAVPTPPSGTFPSTFFCKKEKRIIHFSSSIGVVEPSRRVSQMPSNLVALSPGIMQLNLRASVIPSCLALLPLLKMKNVLFVFLSYRKKLMGRFQKAELVPQSLLT